MCLAVGYNSYARSFGNLDRLLNVPESTIKGAEIDISVRPAHGLMLSAAATYLDAKVKKYDGVIGTAVDENGLLIPITASFAGVRMPFSPKLQYSLRADYTFELSSETDVFLGVGLNGQSESIGILTLSPSDRELYNLNARSIVNANLGIRSADKRWSAQIWGKNIFNKYYWTNTIQYYDTVIRYSARPVEYGVSVGYKF